MAIYVLNPDGSINKDGESIPAKEGYKVAVEALGDFTSARNYAENTHEVFDGIDNSNPIPNENLPDLNNLINPSNSGVIGQTEKLYPYAFGENMNLLDPTTNKLPFYKPYNSFFDLDFNVNGRENNENFFQIFADETDFYGIPAILSDTSNTTVDFANVFSSLADMLLGAILPITVISVLQGTLQAAQGGPPDPFSLFGKIKLTDSGRLGSFINYVKIDTTVHTTIGTVLNAIIDSLISLLKTTERLMNFPSTPLKQADFFTAVGTKILENTLSFIIGYIYYLIPGFKIDDPILSTDPATAIGNLFSSLLSLVFANKAKHNYNLLVYKIVKNNYFRSQIQFKAKTINTTNENYSYQNLSFYQLSDFFHRFIGQRVAVGQKVIGSLSASYYNKRNNIFAIQKMNELPVQKNDEDNNILNAPVSIGSSILGNKDNNANTEISSDFFKKSIYSLTSLVTKTSTANTYLKYHNELVKQNEAIYQKKERRLSREHVQKIEEIINSDYMPFSIQDLRTNEVFKFHAFLENYSDSFQVNWDDGGVGFGRMDPIKTYKGTTRNISTDFWLVSMSPDDFDYMWWMINRLVALIYPQWSAPRPANIDNQLQAGMFDAAAKKHFGIPFSQPFTQIPTGSPLVRLRLGDLFTSNYSKKSLARIFGFELENINQNNNVIKKATDISTMIKNIQSNFLIKTEVLGYDYFNLDDYRSQLNKDTYMFNRLDQVDFYPINELKDDNIINVKKTESSLGDIQKLFKEYSNFYYAADDKINLNDINSPASSGSENKNKFFPETQNTQFTKLIYIPLTVIQDNEEKILMLLTAITVKESVVRESFVKDVAKLFKNKIMNDLNYSTVVENNNNDSTEKLKNVQNLKSFMTGKGELSYDHQNPFNTDINPGTENIMNNPVVYSFESTMGEGIAGTIQTFGINFDQNIPWELTEGSRAPIAVKINLALSVIHDILPGLDDKGIMRAPTYRVGKINRDFFGESVYEDLPINIGYSNVNPVMESPSTTQNNPTPTTTPNQANGFGIKPLELKTFK